MMFSRSLSLFLLAVVIASAVPRLAAQVEPCYCILTATWNADLDRWEVDPCAGNCLPVEGQCKNFAWIQGASLFLKCQCNATSADPICSCIGAVRNPYYDPTQDVPLVICKQVNPCSLVGQTCSHYHLLVPPGIGWPICQCQ